MKNKDTQYIVRCLQLARNGAGYVAPNPMVGAVIVHNEKIIGEGYHRHYGEAHAEPNAINSVKDKSLLKESTMYVSLEPCSHVGKTPPCADLIIACGIPRVVVGTLDPNPKVAGKGIEKLCRAGVEVEYGFLQAECRDLNKCFFTFQEKKRPYISLKWAQTRNGFIDTQRNNVKTSPLIISNELTKLLVHKQRSENQAILIGTNTAVLDNPTLSVRHWSGRNPIRIVIDRNGRISTDSHLFDGSAQTIVYTEKVLKGTENVKFVQLNFDDHVLHNMIKSLYEHNINSVLIEGGSQILAGFIEQNLWDEARIEISPAEIENGVIAPTMPQMPIEEKGYQTHKFLFYKNSKR